MSGRHRARRLERLVCPACLRLRFSPAHWLVRLAGLCPQDSSRQDGPGSTSA